MLHRGMVMAKPDQTPRETRGLTITKQITAIPQAVASAIITDRGWTYKRRGVAGPEALPVLVVRRPLLDYEGRQVHGRGLRP